MFSWINFLLYAFITSVTPGPNNIMAMTNAGKLGFKKTMPFCMGIWCGFTAVMLLCTLLSSTLYELLPMLKTPMLIIGAGYMLFLAWKCYKSDSISDGENVKSSFLSGCLLQFINPKIYIYCIVSMEAYILSAYQGNTLALVGFALLLSTIGELFCLLWAMFGSIFKTLFSKHARVTNIVLALLLVYCAVSLFL